MHIEAKLRPRGLKKGVRTEAFYKAIGYKSEYGPDVRDVVGCLTLSATQKDDFLILAQLFKYYRTHDKPRSLTINIDGEGVLHIENKGETESNAPKTER